MKILIVEDQLIDGGSHHLGQVSDIARCARAAFGAIVDILVNKTASKEAASLSGAVPCLRGVSPGRATAGIKGLLRPLQLALRTLLNAVTLLRWVMRHGPYDLVLVPTGWTAHVVSLMPAAIFAKRSIGRICIQFLCCWDVRSVKGRVSLTLTRCLLRCLRWLHPDLVLFGQTHAVCEEIRGQSDLSVEWMPDIAAEGSLANETLQREQKRSKRSGNLVDRPIVFGSYGFARHEQGSDLLQEAVARFLETDPHANVRFHIYWPNEGFLVDGKHIDANTVLEATGKVVFYRSKVSKEDTLRLMEETDWILLPYRKDSYAKRSSLLATDAICLGLPGIFTEGTFLQFLFEEYGAGFSIKDADVDGIVAAIRKAVADAERYGERARQKRDKAKEVFSAERFCSRLLRDLHERGNR